MELLSPSDANLRRAGACLASGGLVALPTETVYGLGADAFDVRAVARVFEAKARPNFDPLIVHIASLDQVEDVAQGVGRVARTLMERLWPGPLTLILPRRPEVPDLVTSGLPTVALRLPAHPLARAIIAYSGTAVAAPSANPFGYLSPTRAEHVARMLGDKVDLIVDGGACGVGVESTVLDVTVDPPVVLRPGGMAVETIEELIGRVRLGGTGSAPPVPVSPGQLDSHYAPRTPLFLFREGELAERRAEAVARGTERGAGRAAALLFDEAALRRLGAAAAGFAEIRVLSPSGDTVEAAANLFARLHELDALGLDSIWAERAPDRSLGRAINDRLHKASTK
ncbi:MAG TPA: L-threonylcarbamoyladenylate synthase [Rectinemataceae bacterium]|nr:L-threonylcarbamoyladenylate synthase [Rectinemataceae bacterium]